MSSPEAHRHHSSDALLRQIRWLQQLFGYMDQARAVWSAQQLLAQLNARNCPQEIIVSSLALAAALLRQALVLNPLDSGLLNLVGQVGSLSACSQEYTLWLNQVRKLHTGHPRMDNDEARAALARAGTTLNDQFRHLQKESNPLVLLLGIMSFWEQGEWRPVQTLAERLLSTPMGVLTAPLLAWAAWDAGEPELAQRWLSLPGQPSFLSFNLRSEMALTREDLPRAMFHWKQSLDFHPDQSFLKYRAWEIEQAEHPDPGIPNKEKVHVAFYTFNKLETTLRTLEGLLRSNLGSARITLLNNGSTAFSPQDLDRGVAAVGQGRKVQIIHLPVNIGAPAARNWLWHLPEMDAADYVAFLDDDVLLPPDWLDCFLQDLLRFPEVVVVGPRGLNPGSLPTIQYVYRFFLEVGNQKIGFTPTAPLSMDLGQYSYRRPCLSVMGCCHLFDRKRWKALGVPDFDVRFSPSQVDDLDHDIQIWKKGGQVLYDGRVPVVHLQDAGRQAPASRASWSHVWGNHLKMEAKYSREELEGINRKVNDTDQLFFSEILPGRELQQERRDHKTGYAGT